MRAALTGLTLLGVRTNQRFLLDLLADDAFASGETYTHTLESRSWPAPEGIPDEALVAAGVLLFTAREAVAGERDDADRFSPWLTLGAWGRPGAMAGAARGSAS